MEYSYQKKIIKKKIKSDIYPLIFADKKLDGRSRIDRDADNQQLLQLEEKDVVSSVATVLSDLCGPGEWMPMEKLHSEVIFLKCSACMHPSTRVRLMGIESSLGRGRAQASLFSCSSLSYCFTLQSIVGIFLVILGSLFSLNYFM